MKTVTINHCTYFFDEDTTDAEIKKVIQQVKIAKTNRKELTKE